MAWPKHKYSSEKYSFSKIIIVIIQTYLFVANKYYVIIQIVFLYVISLIIIL